MAAGWALTRYWAAMAMVTVTLSRVFASIPNCSWRVRMSTLAAMVSKNGILMFRPAPTVRLNLPSRSMM